MKIKRYVLFKGLSIGMLVVWGFLQPAFFQRFLSEPNFALLTLIYGYGAFLEFFELGLNKPLYASLRYKFIQKVLVDSDIYQGIFLYFLIFLLSILVFVPLSCFLLYASHSSFQYLTISLFSFAIVLNALFSHIRHIFLSIDEYVYYEGVDLLRKALNIACIALLFVDPTYSFTAFANAIGLLILFGVLFLRLRIKHSISYRKLILQVQDIYSLRKSLIFQSDSNNAFIFTFTLTIIHNCPLLLIPFFLTDFDVIEYGLWYKLSYGGAMIVVAISDLTLHNITRNYIGAHLREANNTFHYTLWGALALLSVIWIGFFLFKTPIFYYWVGLAYLFDNYLSITLWIYFICRASQIICSQLLLATGKYFKQMAKISITYMTLMLLACSITLQLTHSLPSMMGSAAIVFIIEGLTYYIICAREFSPKP